MTGLRKLFSGLKNWLRNKQPEHVCVRTYAGKFEFPDKKTLKRFGFDELVQYAEANANLDRIGLDKLPIVSDQAERPEASVVLPLSRVFHQEFNALSLGWARYVAALRNQMK